MTTKILTGTYSAGYTISTLYSELIVNASASIGGVGIVAASWVEVVNKGMVLAGAGAAGGAGQGHGGAFGVDLAATGSVINSGAVTGGKGGKGGYNGVNGYAGGAGGIAIVLAPGTDVSSGRALSSVSVTNHNTIAGGAGGAGATSHHAKGHGGAGGAGGYGIELGSAGSVANGGLILGGAGGVGGYGYYGGPQGGAGGAGVAFAASGDLTNNSGTIMGGHGGMAGDGYLGNGVAGRGGAGFSAQGAATLINNALIEGGQGGKGSAGSAGSAYYGPGGAGGVGVAMTGGTIVNGGTIVGGYNGLYGNGQTSYAGGAAVSSLYGAVNLTNNGLIEGGGAVGGLNKYYGLEVGAGVTAAGGFVLNHGTIMGGAGIFFSGPGAVNNGGAVGSTALIEGYSGIVLDGAGSTVMNYGTIEGLGASMAYSVQFAAPGGLLIAGDGARFAGEIAGGGGTFELNGGGGTITGLGGTGSVTGTDSATFGGFGSYVIELGGWTLAGPTSLAASQNLTANGTLIIDGTAGETVFSGTIGGTGVVVFKGGADTLDGADLAAARMRVSGATMTLEGTIATQGTVSVGPLQGSASTLLIGAGGATLTGGTWAINAGAQGLAASDTLTNASATISGSGDLGEGQMGLINRKAATIDGNTSGFLDIDTGTNRVSNSGLIEASGKGGVVVSGALLNSGTLEANGGVLLVRGNVSGPGSGLIAGGELGFDAAFSENVTFTGTSGTLYLGQSQDYTGSISGFPLAGKALLDLGDIGFVSSTEATFSGTATSGVLTVTDGTHVAKITLIGDYLSATFTASSDGTGGTRVVDATGAAMSTHRFVAAAAGMAGPPGGTIHTGESWSVRQPMLAVPWTMMA